MCTGSYALAAPRTRTWGRKNYSKIFIKKLKVIDLSISRRWSRLKIIEFRIKELYLLKIMHLLTAKISTNKNNKIVAKRTRKWSWIDGKKVTKTYKMNAINLFVDAKNNRRQRVWVHIYQSHENFITHFFIIDIFISRRWWL